MWKYWRANGNCGRCGVPTEIYKVTGKPYSECFEHRLATAKRKMLSMRRLRKSH